MTTVPAARGRGDVLLHANPTTEDLTMGPRHQTGLVLACILGVLAMHACSKKKESQGTAPDQTTPPAEQKLAGAPLTPENAPFASVITGAGYRVVQAKRFPAQVDARRAYIVVYQAKDGGRGGVLYVRGFQDDPPKPVWHWYFADAAPDSVTALDLNRDGLWDARVFMAGGKTTDFVQDADFTFRGAEREGLAAMNGASSQADGLWKAFDADTSTTWRAPAPSYIDIPNPFGLTAGQLSVRLAGSSRPEKLEIGDGTKKVQECDLAATTEEQRFQLNAEVRDLPTIRVTVVGRGKSVELSELELR
jgi:hypothetical protein